MAYERKVWRARKQLSITVFNDAGDLLFGTDTRIINSMFGILRNMVIQTAFAEIPTSLLPPDSSACTSIFTDGGFLASNTPSGVSGSTGFVCIAEFVGHLTLFVISVAASLSLMMLVVNGYRYMIGPAIPGGSSDGAKKGITAAIIGLVLSLLAYIIIDTVIRAVTS